jgi:hypothetical protein|tara:strand:- start:10 stop:204 length:195 start_codon:yes stop_codon:yes gene_type:complete
MTEVDKMFLSIENLKPNTPLRFDGSIVNENTYATIQWEVEGNFTTTNPHSELTWTAVKAEMDKL